GQPQKMIEQRSTLYRRQFVDIVPERGQRNCDRATIEFERPEIELLLPVADAAYGFSQVCRRLGLIDIRPKLAGDFRPRFPLPVFQARMRQNEQPLFGEGNGISGSIDKPQPTKCYEFEFGLCHALTFRYSCKIAGSVESLSADQERYLGR